MSLAARWQSQLDGLRQEGRHRALQPPTGIDFSSNDYLGYARRAWQPIEGVRSGTASRLLRGQHPVWHEVESTLARWHGAEAALIFTSGYTANEGLLATVIEPGDFVASDACNHASIIDGLRLSRANRFVFRHNDLGHLETGLQTAPRAGQRFIVTESLFGMEADRATLVEMAALAERYDARLIVDEAHATGCFGAAGSGLVDALGLRSRVLATIHTGGKALGLPGAYVVGTRLLKEVLINRCRHFLFTTALPPVVGAWWLQTLAAVAADQASRQMLNARAALFRHLLAEQGIETIGTDYLVPLLIGDDAAAVAAAQELQALGFDIRAIRPPTVPVGTARLRVSIHADHDDATLIRLAECLSAMPLSPRTAVHAP